MNFVISVIVGAVIGYITNWLAIKMLFRPHNRIEVFGLHIPFTPGLIPKEKDRIAKSIGTTVGEHLLTSEVLTEVLSGERVNGQIQTWIRNKIEALKNSGKTVKDLLADFFGEKSELILKSIQHKISVFICDQLVTDTFIEKLTDFIESKIYIKYKDAFQEFITEKVKQFIVKLSTSQELKEELEALVSSKLSVFEKDDRSLSEVIPDELTNVIYSYVNKHKREISEGIGQLLKNPFMKIKLKSAIADIVSKNTSKVVTVFVSPENIAQKTISALDTYFENSENDDSVLLVVKTLLDKILKTKVSTIFKEIPAENKKQMLSQLVDALCNYISNSQVHGRVSDIINNNLMLSGEGIKENLSSILKDSIFNLNGNPAFCESIQELTDEIIDAVVNTPVSYILEKVEDETVSKAVDVLMDVYKGLIKNKLPRAIEALDISNIIEEKINTFDAAYVEKLIVEIASRELKAITWLGALLGGIMGLLSPLIQLIM